MFITLAALSAWIQDGKEKPGDDLGGNYNTPDMRQWWFGLH